MAYITKDLCKHFKYGPCKHGDNCNFIHLRCTNPNCLDYNCPFGHTKETSYLILSNQLKVSLKNKYDSSKFKNIIKKLILYYDKIMNESFIQEILNYIDNHPNFKRNDFSKYVFMILIPVNNKLNISRNNLNIRKIKFGNI